ncbi:hypothetical protein KM043_018797 [Ampulex compressa]|nr:hypothetical protein KM043_018797 [Ampulex compressa]
MIGVLFRGFDSQQAGETWKLLSAIREQNSESNKLFLMTKFHNYKMVANDNMTQHIAKIENMARQLTDIDETISTTTLIAKILESLPAKLGALDTAWYSVDMKSQTLENLSQQGCDTHQGRKPDERSR